MTESLVALLTAAITVGVPLIVQRRLRRERRAGRLRTRAGDWGQGNSSTGAVWIPDPHDEHHEPPNGHGDLRG